MRKKLLLSVLLAICLMATACGSSKGEETAIPEDNTPEQDATTEDITEADATEEGTTEEGTTEDIYVGFAAPLTSGEYWNSLTTRTEELLKEDGIKIDVQSAETNMEKQTELVNNFVTMGVSHLIVDPVDPASIEDSLVNAKAKGVNVIVSGSVPENTDAYNIGLAASQTDIGDAVAKAAAAWVDKTYPDAEAGSIGVAIFGVYERDVDTERCDAYKNIEKYTDKAKISVEYNIGWTDSQTKCQNNTELMLQQYPEVKVVLAYGDYSLFVDEVLQRSNVDLTQYACFGNDMSEAISESIKLNKEGNSSVVGTSEVDGDYPALYRAAVTGQLDVDENGIYYLPIKVTTADNID